MAKRNKCRRPSEASYAGFGIDRNDAVGYENYGGTRPLETANTLKWTVINKIILHCVTSGFWALGFGSLMTAFNGSEGVGFGKILFFLHNIFYFPIVLAEYLGLRLTEKGLMKKETFSATMMEGTIGPFPSLATIGWCFVVGFLLCYAIHKSRNRAANKPVEATTNGAPHF